MKYETKDKDELCSDQERFYMFLILNSITA